MKEVIVGLLALGSISAYAANTSKYECLYQNEVATESAVVSNSFKVNFGNAGVRVNNLSITMDEENIYIKHTLDEILGTETQEKVGTKNFRLSSTLENSDLKDTLYITCTLKE